MIATTYRQTNPEPEDAKVNLEHQIDGHHMVELAPGITLYVDASEAYALSKKFQEIAVAIALKTGTQAVA